MVRVRGVLVAVCNCKKGTENLFDVSLGLFSLAKLSLRTARLLLD